MKSQSIDLTGQRFGKLVVIQFDHKKNYDKFWKCQCDCGNIKIVRQAHLKSGHSKSCGCNKLSLDDLSGRQFGYLTVMHRANDYVMQSNGKHYAQWHCKCECGNETNVLVSNLKSGSITSCGCKRFTDLSGQQFGEWTVIRQVDSYVNPAGRKMVRYECRCSCGRYKNVIADLLRSGGSLSCGCKVVSKGENIVIDFLNENHYKFDLHKSFEDCLSDDGHRLNFDFYVKSLNLLIECNGLQHYEPIEFFGGQERFEIQLRHDFLKEEYAKQHGFRYLVLDCRPNKLSETKECLRDFSINIARSGTAIHIDSSDPAAASECLW